MGKRDTKETLQDVKSSQAATQQNFNTARDLSSQTTAGLGGTTAADKANLTQGYTNLPSNVPSVDTSGLADLGSRYKALGTTGGFDPAIRDQIRSDIGGLRGYAGDVGNVGSELEAFGQTGGLDAEAARRFRGLGVYDEYATTGGYSDADKANFKAQALSPISSYATGTKDELARRAAVTGGYTPGMDAASRALRRDTARNIADTSLNANVTLQDRIIANRMAAAQAASQAEGAYQGLRTGNMLRGMEGAASAYGTAGSMMGQAGTMEQSLQEAINRNMLAGMDGEAATQKAIADVQGANANRSMQAQIAGLGGLQDIYGTDVGQLESSRARDLSLLTGQTSADLGYYSPRTQLATQPGIGGNIMNMVGAGLGVAGNFIRPGMGATTQPVYFNQPNVGYQP